MRRRWRRLRHFGYGRRWRVGRFRPYFGCALYALPLPDVGLYFEQCEVTVTFRVGDALNDPVLVVELCVELPARAADALVVVWPGGVARGERRAALRRLRG